MMLALFFWITALCWLFVAVASTVGILDLLTRRGGLANWGALRVRERSKRRGVETFSHAPPRSSLSIATRSSLPLSA